MRVRLGRWRFDGVWQKTSVKIGTLNVVFFCIVFIQNKKRGVSNDMAVYIYILSANYNI